MVVEGEGAWSNVDGEKCAMQRGDLILTPTGLWHEHGHDGTEPVVWLDVLDLPLVYYMEASYHVNGGRQDGQARARRARLCARRRGAQPGVRTQRQALPDAALPLGRRARRAGVAGRRPARSGRRAGDLHQPGNRRPLREHPGLLCADAAPRPDAEAAGALTGHGVAPDRRRRRGADRRPDASRWPRPTPAARRATPPITLDNTSATQPAFLFMADETPLHQKLGVYEVR